MNYDLVVKNGTIVDGSGGARYRADVGILDGKIASIGRIDSKKAKTIDAEGHVVSPGFVDGHTHGCTNILGSDRFLFLLSRCYQCGDG